jgi:hypothetical protein
MSECVKCPHLCLILNLIIHQLVHTKRGVYFLDSRGPLIEEVRIFSGLVRVDNSNDRTQFTVVTSPSPATSPAPPPELDVSVEVDQNPFLLSPLLRHSVHENVATNAVSRTTSSQAISKKRIKKVGKNLSINYIFYCFN